MKSEFFVKIWNRNPAHVPLFVAPTAPSKFLFNKNHLQAARGLKAIYTNMTELWKHLFQQSQSMYSNPKTALAYFLFCRCALSVHYSTQVRWLRENAWCWYHTPTLLDEESHFEPKILANFAGRQIHRLTAKTMIVLELLTVADPKYCPQNVDICDSKAEFIIIDQISSEIEWRRGLHTSRSQIILTQ